MRLEILRFIRAKTIGGDQVYALDELVWTKAAYAVGFMSPSSDAFSADINTAIQKAFIDQMWAVKSTDMLDHLGSEVASTLRLFPDVSQKLNEGKFAHLDDCKSFEQLFLAELSGILEECRSVFQGAMAHVYESDTGQRPTPRELSEDDSGRMLAKLIYHGFRLNRIGAELPSFRMGAGLHAAVRWDTQRRYKPNDLLDFHHAVAAVPYCQYFLTENSLRHLVGNRKLNLSSFFQCQTFSEPSDAVSALSRLAI